MRGQHITFNKAIKTVEIVKNFNCNVSSLTSDIFRLDKIAWDLNIYKLIIIYLQGVMLLRIIKDKSVYVWQDDTNEETKRTQENGKLQKVKRNRAALDVKRGFELRCEQAFVNQ
jgi:thymidylate synthase